MGLFFDTYVVACTVFVGSITYAAIVYRDIVKQQPEGAITMTNMFFPLMVLWSVCLAYFFGFLGISFVDTQALSGSPASFGLSAVAEQAAAQNQREQHL
jgi:uncharacterized membrane protein (DUF485 family)